MNNKLFNQANIASAITALMLLTASIANAATTWSAQDYDLYSGDFNNDGKADVLYIAKDAGKPSGIATADANGYPASGWQQWAGNYLGIQWYGGLYTAVVGDYNHDGRSDVLMQATAAGYSSFLILTDSDGKLSTISQWISPTQFTNLVFTKDQHVIAAGNFDGQPGDELFLQATTPGGTSGILIADSVGQFSIQASSSNQFIDGSLGFPKWSAKDAVINVGDFNGDGRADLLFRTKPKIVMIDYDIPIPVPVYKPSTFGIALAQAQAQPSDSLLSSLAAPKWDRKAYGADWSPSITNAIVGNFDGLLGDDVLLQSKSGSAPNVIVSFAANGSSIQVTQTKTISTSNVSLGGNNAKIIAGNFDGSGGAGIYIQSVSSSGANYVTNSVSESVSAAGHAPVSQSGSYSSSNTIGATPASVDVSANGAASYSIPIQIPKGTAGLTPELSLSYSSGGGNGLVGVGFNLNGLGIIARCPQTLAQDNVTQGVQLLATDQYCLNGNRLRLVSGSQGQSGSVYRTELETFARITAMGNGTQGPQWFQVETKDGLIYEYGNSSDSRIGVPGNTSITRVWALTKVRDRVNNYWSVTYTNEVSSNGSYRPSDVYYGGANSQQSTSAVYQIHFDYEGRNAGETLINYYQGGAINQLNRLKEVQLKLNGGSLVRKYTLTYEVPSSTFNVVSRLKEVQECAARSGQTDLCMAPTTFSWSDMTLSNGAPALSSTAVTDHGYENFYTPSPSTPDWASQQSFNLDINGDGITDVAQVLQVNYGSYPEGSYAALSFFIGGPNGQGGGGAMSVPVGGGGSVYDVDEDGKDDFLYGGQYYHQRTDGSFAWDTAPLIAGGGLLVDVDGDGYLDNVNYGYANNPPLYDEKPTKLIVRFHKRDGTLGFEATTSTAWTAPSGTTLSPGQYFIGEVVRQRQSITHADIDGDGHQDLLVMSNYGWQVLYGNGTGFTSSNEVIVPTSTYSSYFPPVPVDVNGDGCTDFAYPKGAGAQMYWYLAISKCQVGGPSLTLDVATGIAVSGLLIQSQNDDWGSASAADINSDGYMDLVSGPVVLLSNGANLFAFPAWDGGTPTQTQLWSDRNGDGVLDYVTDSQYKPGLSKRPNMLVSAVDGFGKKAQFKYAPLTDSSVYTRGQGNAGKTQDVQSAMYVVKSMTLSDGVGGDYTQTYSYANAKRNISGRGFLGFTNRTIADSRTKLVTEETYNNTVYNDGTQWQYVGTLQRKIVRQPNVGSAKGPIIQDLSQQWSSFSPEGDTNRKYPYVSSSTVNRYDLSGPTSAATFNTADTTRAITTTVTTVNAIDGYGTQYDVTKTVTEGSQSGGLNVGATSTQRLNTPTSPISYIFNDTTNWCVGRTSRTEETRSHSLNATDGAAITRVSEQLWNGPKCRVDNTVVEPGSSWGLTTAIEYDNFNNVSKTTVSGPGIPANIITESNYGTNGHLLDWVKSPTGFFTYYKWYVQYGALEWQTMPQWTKDTNSLAAQYTRDEFGREQRMTRRDGTSTYKTYYNCDSNNSYCGDSMLRYVVRTSERNTSDAELNHADQFFDVMGRVRYEQGVGFAGETIAVQTLYDNRGFVVNKSNPYVAGGSSMSGVSNSYDLLGRLTLSAQPKSDADRTAITSSVAYNGLSATTTDANNRTQTKIASAWGTLQRATDEAGKHTTYTYNAFGDLRTATDPANNTTNIGYNIRGFKDSSNDPDMGSWTYTYDALGRMLTQTDAKNQTTEFVYDGLNRVTKRKDHPRAVADETNWTWDTAANGIGQLASVTSPGGYSETYTYDSKSRRSSMSTVANGATYVMDYTYNPTTGKPETITYPTSAGASRFAVKYGYQSYGYLKDVRDNSNNALLWQANAQDARGHVTQEQFGNNLVTNLNFDQTNGRLNSVQTTPLSNNPVQYLSYKWDNVGNLNSRQDLTQGVTESFGYDVVSRLTSVSFNGQTPTTTAYNDIGNITSKSGVGTYSYPTSGTNSVRPHAVTTAGGNSYGYDSNGNMTSRNGVTTDWTTYNYPSVIRQVGGNQSTLSYGADRNRYREINVDGSQTEDQTNVAGGAFEKVIRAGGTNPGTEYRHYVAAGDKVVAIIKRGTTGDRTMYLHADHLGSTDVITKEDGAIVMRTSFDAWGQRRASNWSGTLSAADKAAIRDSTHRGYTKHQQLDNLNLVHMNGRVYDPAIARFMSADPIIQDPFHSQSFNRYSYVWNNPLNATDPTGFCTEISHTESRIVRRVGDDCKKTDPKKENGGGEVKGGQKEGEGAPTQTKTEAKQDEKPGQKTSDDASSNKVINMTAGDVKKDIAAGAGNDAANAAASFVNFLTILGGLLGGDSDVPLIFPQTVKPFDTKSEHFANEGGAIFKGLSALSGARALGSGAANVVQNTAAKALSKSDFPQIANQLSQKQLRHVAGRPEHAARGGSYLNSKADAQAVLDAYHSGDATILGKSSQGFPIVRFDGVSGTNVNVGAGFANQPTSVFMIKGTVSPSIVPTNPNWVP